MIDRTAAAYALSGALLAAGGAMFALTRARATHPSSYAAGVYHMTRRSHLRFATLSGAFGAAFIVALRWPVLSTPLLAVYTPLLVLYASSFARGFSDEDP